MNWFEQMMLNRIIKKTVKQGGHSLRITKLYGEIKSAVADEFVEDNNATLNNFLEDLNRQANRLY